MGNYLLQMPSKVTGGAGCSDELIEIVKQEKATRVLILTDMGVFKTGIAQKFVNQIKMLKADVVFITDVPTEPEVAQIKEIFIQANSFAPQILAAIGGGSVMDTAKFIASMLKNPEFAEDITNAALIVNRPVDTVMLPTSAGTGSEATQNAIVQVTEKKLKVGIVHPFFIPKYVLLDPNLSVSMPKSVTASTGIDAFCHAIECLISKKGNPFSQAFALRAIRLISQNLVRAYHDGTDLEARENMLLAAFYAGVCINTASTVAVHALSYPLSGSYRIAHGISNAMLLAHVMNFNSDAIIPELALAADAMGMGTGLNDGQKAKLALEAINQLVKDVEIPTSLAVYGITRSDIDFLTDSAMEVRRLLDQNPKPMAREDIKRIYLKLLPE